MWQETLIVLWMCEVVPEKVNALKRSCIFINLLWQTRRVPRLKQIMTDDYLLSFVNAIHSRNNITTVDVIRQLCCTHCCTVTVILLIANFGKLEPCTINCHKIMLLAKNINSLMEEYHMIMGWIALLSSWLLTLEN